MRKPAKRSIDETIMNLRDATISMFNQLVAKDPTNQSGCQRALTLVVMNASRQLEKMAADDDVDDPRRRRDPRSRYLDVEQ